MNLEGHSWLFLHPITANFQTEIRPVKTSKNFGSGNQSKIFNDILNVFFDGSHLVNEIEFSAFVKESCV